MKTGMIIYLLLLCLTSCTPRMYPAAAPETAPRVLDLTPEDPTPTTDPAITPTLPFTQVRHSDEMVIGSVSGA